MEKSLEDSSNPYINFFTIHNSRGFHQIYL
jgi:hypothetical protein